MFPHISLSIHRADSPIQLHKPHTPTSHTTFLLFYRHVTIAVLVFGHLTELVGIINQISLARAESLYANTIGSTVAVAHYGPSECTGTSQIAGAPRLFFVSPMCMYVCVCGVRLRLCAYNGGGVERWVGDGEGV